MRMGRTASRALVLVVIAALAVVLSRACALLVAPWTSDLGMQDGEDGMMHYGTGWKRDRAPHVVGWGRKLFVPSGAASDGNEGLASFAGDPLDQTTTEACVPHAVVKALDTLQRADGIVRPLASRDLLWAMIRSAEGTLGQNVGVSPSDAALALAVQGVTGEDVAPWDPAAAVGAQARAWNAARDAATHKLTAFQRIGDGAGAVPGITTAIDGPGGGKRGYVVTLGLSADGSFQQLGPSDVWDGPVDLTVAEDHYVTILGYARVASDPGGGRLLGLNSWGKRWCNNGLFWMSYRAASDAAHTGDILAFEAGVSP